MIDELQDIVDSNKLGIDEIHDVADTPKINKFKRKIVSSFDEIKNVDELIDNKYIEFLAKSYLNKSRITNKDIILFLIMLEYLKLAIRLNDLELFNTIILIAHKHAENECKRVLGRDKKTRPINVLNTMLMTMPNHLGSIWSDYIQNEINYNANQLFKQIMIDIQQGNDIDLDSDIYKRMFEKQQRTHLNINEDKTSGAVETQTDFLVNKIIFEVGKDYGMEKCKFIGVCDDKQTKMCESLHGKIFYLNKMNEYDRYSSEDDKIIRYKTFGLKLGENLPPITNSFHFCRSTITYQIDEELVDETSKKLLEMNRVAQEQYNRYKKYYGDELNITLKEFIEIRRNNPKEWERLKKEYYDKRREYNERK